MKKDNTIKTHTGDTVTRQEYGKPFCIDIKNNTDEKLFNVEVFNHEYKSQSKIGYSIPFDGVEYYDLLAMLNTKDKMQSGINIQLIKIIALGESKKFVNKQLSTHILFAGSADDTILIKKDLYAILDYIVDIEYPFLLMKQTKMKLAFLMPELEVKLYLFPSVPKS